MMSTGWAWLVLALGGALVTAGCSLANAPEEPVAPGAGGTSGTTAQGGEGGQAGGGHGAQGGQGGQGGACELNTLENCGACGTPCSPVNADGATCETGQCDFDTCHSGYDDCDDDTANGCETDIAGTVESCGACGNDCADAGFSNVSALVCTMGACDWQGCAEKHDDCDGKPENGCEQALDDMMHCGACTTACAPKNVTGPTCTGGTCSYASCSGPFQDCDNDTANGCETSKDDPQHCGACNKQCLKSEDCIGGQCLVVLAFTSYNPSQTFTDGLGGTSMTMAWDGSYYWSCSGGTQSGQRLARYSSNGAMVAAYSPGIDFRSVFTIPDGGKPVYARGYNNMTLLQQGSFGVFSNWLTLQGTLDSQSSVTHDKKTGELVAMSMGTVYRWSPASGKLITSFTLAGFGTLNNENNGVQNRGIVAAGGYYLTYSEGVLSAWSQQGVRVDTATLVGAGQSSDSYYSFSYANGRVWIVDAPGGKWRGYSVGL